MQNLKIKAHLGCGIISDHTLPIDGILLYAATRQRYGPQIATIPGQCADYYKEIELPLHKVDKHSDKWFYSASFACWSEPVAKFSNHWNKRFDQQFAQMLDHKKRKIQIGEGRYKAYHMPVFARHSLSVWWYVRGNPYEIGNLLDSITNIGKKTDQGWGEVLDWTIDEIDYDWSIRYNHQPTRAIPISEPQVTNILYCGYRPPYWLQENQTMCIVPTNLHSVARVIPI